MRLTQMLIDDMVELRKSLRQAYNEELCDKVDPSVRRRLSQELHLLAAELTAMSRRTGISLGREMAE